MSRTNLYLSPRRMGARARASHDAMGVGGPDVSNWIQSDDGQCR